MTDLSRAAAIVLPSWIPRELADERVPLLRQTIESIWENTRWPFELVVVDQGEGAWQTDVLADLVRRKRIHHLICNAWNAQYAGGLDLGVRITTTPWLAFSANDLEYESGWLGTLISAVDAVGTPGGDGREKVIAVGAKGWHKGARHVAGQITVGGEFWDYMTRGDPYCWVMRRAAYAEVGPFPWVLHGDAMATTRAAEKGWRWICPPRELVHHKGPRGSIRGELRARMVAETYDRRRALALGMAEGERK